MTKGSWPMMTTLDLVFLTHVSFKPAGLVSLIRYKKDNLCRK